MILSLIIVTALLVSISALHEVLVEKVEHYGDANELQSQLSSILNKSHKLLELRLTAQGLNSSLKLKQILSDAAPSSFNVSKLLQTLSKKPTIVESLVESHPILSILARRAYLASIILKWIDLGQEFPKDGLEQELAAIVLEFYRIHVRSVIRRGVLEYLHISKSGGTSFSAAAKRSRCQMARGIGQLEMLGDFPRWIDGQAFEEVTGGTGIMWSYYSTSGRPEEGQGCSRRLAHLAALGCSYVSNEFTLHSDPAAPGHGHGIAIPDSSMLSGTHVCQQTVNVVTLREPGHRLASHLHYMLARIKKRFVVKAGHNHTHFLDVFCSGDVAVWERVAPTVIDNYIVRSFVGERAFHSPVGGIGREHVEAARRLLLQFDLVLDLDAGEREGDLLIQQGLGWDVSLSELHVRTASASFVKLNYSREECLNEELLRLLLPRQHHDVRLYRTGRALAFLDGVFLGVSRVLGLQPSEVAEATAVASEAASATTITATKSNKDNKDNDNTKMAAACGLLQPMSPSAAAAAAGRSIGTRA